MDAVNTIAYTVVASPRGDQALFDWDEHNEAHVREHGVELTEVEQALSDPDRIGAAAYRGTDERRWAYLGATEGRRVLFVVYTRRGRHICVVTARDATEREKRRYRE
ncbi:MAG: BrnT family toxin [Actinomycetota bacterium]